MPAPSQTFRVDWPTGGDQIDVAYFQNGLNQARAKALRMSERFGSAYVIRTTDGLDDGQVAYTDGAADSRTWETA